MKSLLSLALLLVLFDAPSWSQAQTATPPASDAPKFDQSDLKKARDLEHVEELWNKRFDWKEKNSSTSDIAAHLRQIVGNDVAVEVRGQDSNLSTFGVSQSRLGPTLCSILTLANAKAWAFPGRLLIAPKNLLTPEEANAAKVGMGGEWKESYTGGGSSWNAFNKFQQIALTLVGNDLKERFAAKGLTPASPPPRSVISGTGTGTHRVVTQSSSDTSSFAYELPLGDLSPSTKEILQIMLDAQSPLRREFMLVQGQKIMTANGPVSLAQLPTLSLSASTLVSFDDTQGSQMQLVIQQVDPKDAKKIIVSEQWYASKPQPPSAS